MFRVKVTAALSFIIIAFTIVAYLTLPASMEKELLSSADRSLDIAATGLERSERLDDFALVAKSSAIAEFPRLKTALTGEYSDNYEYQRHLGVYNNGLLRWQYAYENLAKEKDSARDIELSLEERRPFTPDLVFVTDEKGSGVAALGKGKYDWYNVDVAAQQPIVLKASLGESLKDVWAWKWSASDDEGMFRVGVSPVMQGTEKMIGVVVVGMLINNGAAKRASADVGGHDVAYFYKGRIYGSTLKPDDASAVAKQHFDEIKITDQGVEPEAVRITIDGAEHLALVRYHSGSASDTSSGFIVLTNLDDDLAVVGSTGTMILIFGLLLLVLSVGTVFTFLHFFYKAFEQIDQGIQEVIAGNKETEFVITGNYSFQREMARSLNLMSAYLQGKKLPDEEETSEESWGDLMVEDVSATGMMRAVHAADLSKMGKPKVAGVALPGMPPPSSSDSEPDEPEVIKGLPPRELYDAYISAKKNLGEDVSDIDFDGFAKRLERNRTQLKAKHSAKDIAFTVIVRDGKVVLKPQPIL